MGADLAVTASSRLGHQELSNFKDTTIVSITIQEGNWVIMGRAFVRNFDGDSQEARGKLHGANSEIDSGTIRLSGVADGDAGCIYLQGCLTVTNPENITLQCSTYRGLAFRGSLIAFKVDQVQTQ